jgi:hypothetical protein
VKYQLGLKPVQAQPRLKLVDYLKRAPKLPTPPAVFGHADLVAPHMFMNDKIGDCAIAGSIEEVRLLNAERKVTVPFSDETAVANYSAITGYNPADPSTDQGTDVHDLYQYRKNTGIVDDAGNHHKIVAYVGLTPGNFHDLVQALYLFTTVGIGINVPDYAEQQFEAGGPWEPEPGYHKLVGGHYIPAVARNGRTVDVFTWGGKIAMTDTFYKAFNTVSVVSFTEEMLIGDKTIDGFDREKLLADLPAFNTGPVMAEAPKKEAA